MNLLDFVAILAQTGTETSDQSAGGLQQMLPLFAMIMLLFYFLILRPQKKEQQKRQEQISQVGKGDTVVTIGGIHGKVESVDNEAQTVKVTVAPKITMVFNLAAISSIEKKKGGKSDAESSES